MGMTPPPARMTKAEFIKTGKRDIAFENWLKYSNPFVRIFYFVKEKIFKIESKSMFCSKSLNSKFYNIIVNYHDLDNVYFKMF